MPTVPARIQSTRPTSPITILGQQVHIRTQLRLVEHLTRESGPQRKPIERERNHARHIGIGLFQRDAGLEPGDASIAEFSDAHVGPIELEGQQHGRIGAQELERGRQNADDLTRPAIDVQ